MSKLYSNCQDESKSSSKLSQFNCFVHEFRQKAVNKFTALER